MNLYAHICTIDICTIYAAIQSWWMDLIGRTVRDLLARVHVCIYWGFAVSTSPSGCSETTALDVQRALPFTRTALYTGLCLTEFHTLCEAVIVNTHSIFKIFGTGSAVLQWMTLVLVQTNTTVLLSEGYPALHKSLHSMADTSCTSITLPYVDVTIETTNFTAGALQVLTVIRPHWKEEDVVFKVSLD